MMTLSGNPSFPNSSSIIFLARSLLYPPEPTPISGKAMDWNPFSAARVTAFLTESRIDRSDSANCQDIATTLRQE